ncbi:hypothetical protein BGZ49_001698, partial [Haplosporangium sp. Z 27]
AHGGTVTRDEKTAFILLANQGQRYHEQMYSTEWVNDCIQQESLINHDEPTYKLKLSYKKDKTPFSIEDDRLLRKFIQEKRSEGAKLKGNIIYQEFAAKNPQHPYHSWRDRAVRVLSLADPESSYAASKARREEQLRKLQETRDALQVKDNTVNVQQQQRTEANQTNAVQPSESLNDTDSLERNTSPVVETSLDDRHETLEYQTQSASQMSPLVLDFSDINSDEEEDEIHRQEMEILSLRRVHSGASQVTPTLEDFKPIVTNTINKDVKVDKLGSVQSQDVIRTSTNNSNARRHLSLSPPKEVNTSSRTKVRNSRLSLPNMNRTYQAPTLSKDKENLNMRKNPKKSSDAVHDIDSSEPITLSITEEKSMTPPPPTTTTLPSLTSWENPPQSDLPMPSSLSPTVNTPAAMDVPETDQIELTDEDDITIEEMVLNKMRRSSVTSSGGQNLDNSLGLATVDDSEPDNQNKPSEVLLVDEGQELDINLNEPESIDMASPQEPNDDPILSAKQNIEEPFYDFVLPAKLLTGRSSGLRSPNVEKNIGASPSRGSSILEHSVSELAVFDGRETSIEGAKVIHEGKQGEINFEGGSKQESIKHHNQKANRKLSRNGAAVQSTHEQHLSNGNDDRNLGDAIVKPTLGVDREAKAGKTNHTVLAVRHKRHISTEGEEEEEEILIRRKRLVRPSQALQPLQPSQKIDSKENVLRAATQISTGRRSELDAVQEYYAGGLENNSNSENSVGEEHLSRERLLLYLRDLYRKEIRTLVMHELVPPLKAIDILDACSGDLKLARTFINNGITENIQSQFWTRQDDCKVFSKKKEDEIDLYLTKTRADAALFEVSPGALQASGLVKRKPQLKS